MALSPPPLSRSPVSSPNTDYPSPDLEDPRYTLSSLYGQSCGMDPNLEPESLTLDAASSAEWTATLLNPTTSAGIPNILTPPFDSFTTFGSSVHHSYPHNHYAVGHTHAAAGSLSPQPFLRALSHSPDTLSRPAYLHRHSISPQPQVKMENACDYTDPESSRYPSPHNAPAMPVEIGGYSSAASSSGYQSDPPSDPWTKPEYSSLEPDMFTSSSAQIQDRQPYRMQRAPRSRPRKLTTKEDANYQCEVQGCGKLFSRSYNYKAHLETHDENREYPFPCTIDGCPKKFVRKTDLTRHHQSVHMKEKNHRCDFCQRMFARKDTLRR